MRAKLLDRLQQRGQRDAEQRSRGPGLALRFGERSQDVLLAPRPEAGQRAQLFRFGGLAQPLERRDAELVPDPAGRLRPQARNAHELDDLRGHELLVLRQRVHLAVLDDLDDLLLDRLADALELLRLAVERHLCDGGAGLADPRRGAPVGEHAERLHVLELEDVGQQLELRGDVGVRGQARPSRPR